MCGSSHVIIELYKTIELRHHDSSAFNNNTFRDSYHVHNNQLHTRDFLQHNFKCSV